MTTKGKLGAVGFSALVAFTTISFVSSKFVSASGSSPVNPGLYVLPDAGVNNDVTAGKQIGFDWQGGDSQGSGTTTATLTASLPTNPGLSWSIAWSTQPCTIIGGATLSCTFTISGYTHIGVDVVSATSSASDGSVTVSGTLAEGGVTVFTAVPITEVIG